MQRILGEAVQTQVHARADLEDGATVLFDFSRDFPLAIGRLIPDFDFLI